MLDQSIFFCEGIFTSFSIMALCWPVTPSEVKFAVDSLLEEGVLSELVSEPKFPASWENTGNFVRRGLRVRLLARNPASNSMVCEPIPYASEQGIYFGLAGN
jgi:hypothetical protein